MACVPEETLPRLQRPFDADLFGVVECRCVVCHLDELQMETFRERRSPWVEKNADGTKGLCMACERSRAVRIFVSEESCPRACWVAESLTRRVETSLGCKSAVSQVARKMFGPGSLIYWLTPAVAVAVPPTLEPAACSASAAM